MKRTLTAGAVFALVLLGAPSPANALPEVCPLGVVCATVDPEGRILNEAGEVIGRTLETLPAPVTVTASPSTTTAPAPPARTVTATRTATRTATETATRTAAPTTVTETATETATRTVIPPGQNGNRSDTLDAAPPNVPVPGPVEAGIDIIPDDPETAAATGSVFGLFAGILIGLVGLYVAYRRGQIDGEKATLKEFLGMIRGEPQPGRHRA